MMIRIIGKDKQKKYFQGALDRIRNLQDKDGAIPWFEDGSFDAWNHLESLMALNIFNYEKEVKLGFDFLRNNQQEDGSWLGELGSTLEIEENDGTFVKREEKKKSFTRNTNFTAYIATAVWHNFLLNGSLDELNYNWSMIESAIHFVLLNQSEEGSIRWAAESPEAPDNDALITGCCSIFKSMISAINCARTLNKDTKTWEESLEKLKEAIICKPHLFDKTWESKKRFSMDWYYPVLCGVVTGKEAEKRISEKWNEFVVEEIGCLCVSDQPWVTIAETAELAITLAKIGNQDKAYELLSWTEKCRDKDGAYWMGRQYSENVFWPAEKPGWTSAAVILATDALSELSLGSEIFLKDDLI